MPNSCVFPEMQEIETLAEKQPMSAASINLLTYRVLTYEGLFRHTCFIYKKYGVEEMAGWIRTQLLLSRRI